jgi:LuxR family transcriptional regulator, maltose regulon positive regulatory protein
VLEMSVPPWFDVEVIEEMTGHAHAASMCETLVRVNPFMIDLGGGSMRFHHLIGGLLRAELRWRSPERWVDLHRAAATAMRRRQRVDVAIELLMVVGDIDECVDLIAAPVLSLMDAGKLREVKQWFQLLPPVEPTDPERVANYALALTIVGRPDLAEQVAARLGELIAASHGSDPAKLRRLEAVQALTMAAALTAAGRWRSAASLLPDLLAADGDRVASAQLDARWSSQVARLSLLLGQLDTAERWIPDVERHRSTVVAQVHGPALRAWWWLAQGRADRALDTVEPAIAAAAALGVRPHPAAADADIAHGLALLTQLRLREAGEAVERLDADADALSWPFFLLRRWPLMMQFRALDEGWAAAANLSLSWTTANFPGRGGDLVDLLAAVQARALIGVGRIDEAAARIDLLPMSRDRNLLKSRIATAVGDIESAERHLTGHDGWPVPERIEALLVLASGAAAASASTAAVALVREALHLARAGRWWAPFALEGGAVPRLLDDVGPADLPSALLPWRSSARETRRPDVLPRTLLDPITSREAAVLELLPSHLTYQAIGAELYVSVNTVKTYVSGIYRKLGVSSRSEAVRAARAAGLLND